MQITPLEFLEAVYSNEELPLSARLKAASDAAQYVHPKLAVTANVVGDFADRLDRAIEASRKVIEAKPMIEANDTVSDPSDTKPVAQPSNGGHKPSIPDRRFRRW